MPTKEILFLNKTDFEFNENDIAFLPHEIKLKKTDESGNYSLEGKYSKPGEIICPNILAAGITELFGFEEIAEQNSGEVLYQLSNDDGATWKYWDNENWVETNEGFNSSCDIDKNISSFPLTSKKQLKVKIRIVPSSDNENTPVLKMIALHYELDYNHVEDVKRTLKHYIETNFKPKLNSSEIVPADTDNVVLNTDFQVVEILNVYNLSADPERTTNIFNSIEQVETGQDENNDPLIENRIKLNLIQPAGSIIETNYIGTVPVFLSADEDFQVSKLPSILLEIPTITENKSLRNYDRKTERNNSNLKVRTRQQSTWYDAQVVVSCLAETELYSLEMISEVQKLFNSQDMKLVSESSGEELELYDLTPFTDSDRVTIGLSVKQTSFILCTKYWLGKYQEKQIAQKLELNVFNI